MKRNGLLLDSLTLILEIGPVLRVLNLDLEGVGLNFSFFISVSYYLNYGFFIRGVKVSGLGFWPWVLQFAFPRISHFTHDTYLTVNVGLIRQIQSSH